MLAWLTANAPVVMAVGSAASAFAAIMIMFATLANVQINRRLAADNRALAKAGSEPRVVGYATISPNVWAAIDFVVRNIGKGPARNVSYRIISGGDDLNSKNVRLLPAGTKYAFLPQDEQLSAFMGMGWDLLAPPALAAFEIEIEWENLAGSKQSARYKIDAAQFEGLHRLGAPPDEEMADALKKIAKLMDGWSHNRLQVETMSVTERRERNAEVRRLMEERRTKRGAPSNPPTAIETTTNTPQDQPTTGQT